LGGFHKEPISVVDETDVSRGGKNRQDQDQCRASSSADETGQRSRALPQDYLQPRITEEARLPAVITKRYLDHMLEIDVALDTGMRKSEQYGL
jgi:hypothetical protein